MTYLDFYSTVYVALATDCDLSDGAVSSVKWNGRADEVLVVASGDNTIRAYSYDADSGSVRFKFSHDGHRSPVTDAVSHPRVAGLVLSADARGHLHAWAPGKVIVADL